MRNTNQSILRFAVLLPARWGGKHLYSNKILSGDGREEWKGKQTERHGTLILMGWNPETDSCTFWVHMGDGKNDLMGRVLKPAKVPLKKLEESHGQKKERWMREEDPGISPLCKHPWDGQNKMCFAVAQAGMPELINTRDALLSSLSDDPYLGFPHSLERFAKWISHSCQLEGQIVVY